MLQRQQLSMILHTMTLNNNAQIATCETLFAADVLALANAALGPVSEDYVAKGDTLRAAEEQLNALVEYPEGNGEAEAPGQMTCWAAPAAAPTRRRQI